MYQPSLPVRWEIVNVGVTASPSTMMCICYAVYIEGSDFETGFENAVSTNQTPVTLAASPNDIKGVLAIRLKNTVNGQPNRARIRLKDWQIVTSLTTRYRILMLQDKGDITLANGNPVTDGDWTSATPTGWCESLIDFRLADAPDPANAVVLFDGYAAGGTPGGPPFAAAVRGVDSQQTDNRSSSIYQNYDSTDSMIIAIVAYRLGTANAEILASLNWIEIK
jgi:hypothetical protein